MKKLEMLGKIWEILYKETDLEEEGLKLLSEQILDMVEKNGMLPPNTTFYEDRSDGKTICIPCNDWDEE